eukprot:2880274-Prymnesium_polylepis.1
MAQTWHESSQTWEADRRHPWPLCWHRARRVRALRPRPVQGAVPPIALPSYSYFPCGRCRSCRRHVARRRERSARDVREGRGHRLRRVPMRPPPSPHRPGESRAI